MGAEKMSDPMAAKRLDCGKSKFHLLMYLDTPTVDINMRVSSQQACK